jgi:hypothetical protein
VVGSGPSKGEKEVLSAETENLTNAKHLTDAETAQWPFLSEAVPVLRTRPRAGTSARRGARAAEALYRSIQGFEKAVHWAETWDASSRSRGAVGLSTSLAV